MSLGGGAAHQLGGGMSVGWWHISGVWYIDFGSYLVDDQGGVGGGVKQRSCCSRNHWSSNTAPFSKAAKEQARYGHDDNDDDDMIP